MNERAGHMPNKRRHTRFTLKPALAVDVLGDALLVTHAYLVNLSRSGAAILADVLMGDPGVVVKLDLPDHTASQRAPVPCELRWVLAEKGVLPQRWLHGALFGEFDAQTRGLVEQLISDARRTEASP